jgi:SNF2 family DNA or RNA helicase
MTGTPVENTPLDLWSQCRFAIPGLLPPREAIELQLQNDPELAIAQIKRQIRPFLLRRTKAEVLTDLPPKTEITLRTPLRDDEQLVYNTLITAARKELLSQVDDSVSVMAVLEAILRLRQACCDVRLVKATAPDTPSSKIETLIDSLEEAIAGGHRCLIFSQWVSMLDLVEKELLRRNLSFLRLDGSTTNRGSIVDRFQSSDGPPLFLISLKAGGVGLTLTAADHVFVLDPWWNPAVEEQATDRTHRIGQKNPVFVYRLIASDTIEERILELQERKRSLARSLLGESSEALSVSREELLELLA